MGKKYEEFKTNMPTPKTDKIAFFFAPNHVFIRMGKGTGTIIL